jgi:hypothetical protein
MDKAIKVLGLLLLLPVAFFGQEISGAPSKTSTDDTRFVISHVSDAGPAVGFPNGCGNQAVCTWNHFISGTHPFLVIGSSFNSSINSLAYTSIGASCGIVKLLPAAGFPGTLTPSISVMYYVKAPKAGMCTISLYLNFPPGNAQWNAGSVLFAGVDQDDPLDAEPVGARITSTSARDVIVTRTPGAWVVDMIGMGATSSGASSAGTLAVNCGQRSSFLHNPPNDYNSELGYLGPIARPGPVESCYANNPPTPAPYSLLMIAIKPG